MDDATEGLSRRTLFAAGGLGVLALAGLASAAQAAASAAPAGGSEKANVKVVDDFIKTWSAKDFDADKVCADYLASDASVRMQEDKPPLVGPAAVAAGFKSFTGDGSRVKVKILQTFAKGPVVVISRVDTLTSPGKPEQSRKGGGGCSGKNGKIKGWTDCLAT